MPCMEDKRGGVLISEGRDCCAFNDSNCVGPRGKFIIIAIIIIIMPCKDRFGKRLTFKKSVRLWPYWPNRRRQP